ncbi:hypothetical protein BpHYR1_038801 [Brachionus plicatilis]|uniref:Uncharacterized protein n=1 Tax=Brachionus plicatilis TaxID=10195 RepID=A0A3M7QAE2_BRAPC|nr:hypothetical protein BpHYR1_038801 [Brachionus plicatilis]
MIFKQSLELVRIRGLIELEKQEALCRLFVSTNWLIAVKAQQFRIYYSDYSMGKLKFTIRLKIKILKESNKFFKKIVNLHLQFDHNKITREDSQITKKIRIKCEILRQDLIFQITVKNFSKAFERLSQLNITLIKRKN